MAARGESIAGGIIFCEVNSWLTGRRLVSLPFSDHCDPLMDLETTEAVLQEWVPEEQQRAKWNYIQIRPTRSKGVARTGMAESSEFWLHVLSLEPPTETLFKNLNKDNLQRRIRRAEREGIAYERGSSKILLDQFYKLMIMTRRRHRVVPQPRIWFENLASFMGPDLEIRIARKGATPVAALLALRCGNKVVYKYGCSDERFHYVGGMPFLFWRLIEESKTEGAESLDFGRTDPDNKGLTEFKDRFGAQRQRLVYFEYPEPGGRSNLASSPLRHARKLFGILPDMALSGIASCIYRHFG